MSTKKTILLCGATGFIGRNLLEFYGNNEDYHVRAVYNIRPKLDEYDVEWVKADLNNPSDVQRAVKGVDIILQFAATTSGAGDIVSKPYIHVTDNAVMNSLLLREAYEQHVEHFVFPSCTVMYQPSETALSEIDFDGDEELLPKYYGVGNTKVYIEKMCEFYSRLGRTRHTVLRHSNIYGPYDKFDLKRSHVFGATITKVLTSDEKIIVWGPGTETRDFLYIDDLIEFIDAAINKQEWEFGLYNVGCGFETSIKSLVELIIEASGKDLATEHDLTKPHIPTSLFLDCEEAKDDFGWSPKTTLQAGIMKTIDWWRKNYA